MAFVWKHPASKFWIARFYDIEGKRRNRSTKVVATEKNRRKAEKIAETYEEAASRKQTALQVRKVLFEFHEELTGERLETATVREQVARWLDRKRASTKPSTHAFYRGATSKFLKHLGERADTDIGEITRDDISGFRDGEAARVTAKTANHALKCIRMFFKDALRDRLITEDPTEFVDTVRKETRTERRPFTRDELDAVIRVADKEWRSMIYFGLYTGQRIGDIARLTWENVDLDRAEIRLITGKTGRHQTIPMASPLKRHLKSMPAGDDPAQPIHPEAFTSISRQGKTSGLSTQFAKLLEKAGLREIKTPSTKRSRRKGQREEKPESADGNGSNGRREINPLSFHSLRGTATTLLHEAGVPNAVAQELIGHDSEEVHRAYVKVGKEALKGATDLLSKIDVVQ